GPHRIPDILQDAPYRDLPLYMLVAWWVYRQTVPVSVRDVSEAFHISARRAGDLLLYLMNSVSHVQCTRGRTPDGGLVTWLKSLLRNRAAAREPVLTALKEDSMLDVKALPVVQMINGKNSGKTCW
ncbi:CaiF/GrlA family transcriptional regulator, partial [Salmonella enterica]|nr:CaiF/GrlA family transcriptional regulator [Salmonella enterica]